MYVVVGVQGEQVFGGNGLQGGIQVGMYLQLSVFVIVQVGVFELFVVQVEIEWFDQVQLCVGVGVEVDYIVGVWWNFGLEQDDVECR